MSGPLRKKKDHKRHKIPLEWIVDNECCDSTDDIYNERSMPEEVRHRLSVLKSHQHRMNKRIKQGKKVLEINGSYWSFHNGDSGFAYHLSGLDEEGDKAVKTLSKNSFDSVYEARVTASLIGYEAYQSGKISMTIE